MRKHRTSPQIVKLPIPYELSCLSVFWITSKSNHKYTLDVMREVFSRSGRTKTRHREASWLSISFILGKNMSLYMVPEALILHQVHKMTFYRQRMHRLHPLLHLAKEPCVFRKNKSITLHLFGFTFIHAEIKSNSCPL